MASTPVWKRPKHVATIAGLLVLGLVGVVFLTRPSVAARAATSELAYLPDSTEMIVVLRPSSLWTAPFLQGLTSRPEVQKQVAEAQAKTGLEMSDIASIVVAISQPEKAAPLAGEGVPMVNGLDPATIPGVMVVRSRKPFDVEKLVKFVTQSSGSNDGRPPEPVQVGAVTYYRLQVKQGDATIPAAAFLPDEQTLIFGREADVKPVLSRKDPGQPLAGWGFFDLSQDLAVGMSPKDPAGLKSTAAGADVPESMAKLKQALNDSLRAASFGLTVREGIALQVQFDCLDAKKSAEVRKLMDASLADVRSELREKLDEAQPLAAFMPVVSDLIGVGQKLLDSLKVSQQGTTLALTGSIPAESKDTFARIPDAVAAMFQPFPAGNEISDATPFGPPEPEQPPAPVTAITPEAFEKSWKLDLAVESKPAKDVIETLLADTGLTLAATPAQAKALASPVTLKLEGKPRTEALEEVCRQIGMHPVFDQVAFKKIRLGMGPRSLPVAVAGPFLIVASELEERVPHATGALKLHAVALGLPPGLTTWLEKQRHEMFRTTRVTGPQEADLVNGEAGISMFGGGRLSGSVVQPLTVELRNLLKNVTALEHVEGHVRLTLPAQVTRLKFDALANGQKQSGGDIHATLKDVVVMDQQSSVTLECTGATDESLDLAAFDAAGKSLQRFGAFGTTIEGKVIKSFTFSGKAARLEAVVTVASQPIEYPFTLPAVPLKSAAKMPAQLEALKLDGAEAATFEFLKIAGDPNFRKVLFKTANHTNKPIQRLSLRIQFFDASGKAVKDQPFEHFGETDFLPRGATKELEVAAFFMPPETVRATAVLKKAWFADGTTWERPGK